MLKTDPFVYENRKQVIQTLIDKSHAYKELVLTMEDTFRTRLLPLNLPKKKLDVVVKNFIYSPKYNMTELVQTFDSLIDYLDYTMMLLNMLNDNPEKWFSEDNELHINDDDFLQTYNQNIEVLWEKEAKLQKLLGQVFN